MRALAAAAVRPLRARAAAFHRRQMHAALDGKPVPSRCSACGSSGEFETRPVINRKLARQWRLGTAERAAVNIQQGHTCTACGNNLRGRSLADAIVTRLGGSGPLSEVWTTAPPTTVLEVNPAAALTPMLRGAARHVRTQFPDVDMQQLPFSDGEFDLVVHSDTLEHVPDPVRAISECLRVAGDGWVVFTTPVLFDRLTRNRSGRSASFHGGDLEPALVHWEFGADIVSLLFDAGATEVGVTRYGHPYACAFSCRRTA